MFYVVSWIVKLFYLPIVYESVYIDIYIISNDKQMSVAICIALADVAKRPSTVVFIIKRSIVEAKSRQNESQSMSPLKSALGL